MVCLRVQTGHPLADTKQHAPAVAGALDCSGVELAKSRCANSPCNGTLRAVRFSSEVLVCTLDVEAAPADINARLQDDSSLAVEPLDDRSAEQRLVAQQEPPSASELPPELKAKISAALDLAVRDIARNHFLKTALEQATNRSATRLRQWTNAVASRHGRRSESLVQRDVPEYGYPLLPPWDVRFQLESEYLRLRDEFAWRWSWLGRRIADLESEVTAIGHALDRCRADRQSLLAQEQTLHSGEQASERKMFSLALPNFRTGGFHVLADRRLWAPIAVAAEDRQPMVAACSSSDSWTLQAEMASNPVLSAASETADLLNRDILATSRTTSFTHTRKPGLCGGFPDIGSTGRRNDPVPAIDVDDIRDLMQPFRKRPRFAGAVRAVSSSHPTALLDVEMPSHPDAIRAADAAVGPAYSTLVTAAPAAMLDFPFADLRSEPLLLRIPGSVARKLYASESQDEEATSDGAERQSTPAETRQRRSASHRMQHLALRKMRLFSQPRDCSSRGSKPDIVPEHRSAGRPRKREQHLAVLCGRSRSLSIPTGSATGTPEASRLDGKRRKNQSAHRFDINDVVVDFGPMSPALQLRRKTEVFVPKFRELCSADFQRMQDAEAHLEDEPLDVDSDHVVRAWHNRRQRNEQDLWAHWLKEAGSNAGGRGQQPTTEKERQNRRRTMQAQREEEERRASSSSLSQALERSGCSGNLAEQVLAVRKILRDVGADAVIAIQKQGSGGTGAVAGLSSLAVGSTPRSVSTPSSCGAASGMWATPLAPGHIVRCASPCGLSESPCSGSSPTDADSHESSSRRAMPLYPQQQQLLLLPPSSAESGFQSLSCTEKPLMERTPVPLSRCVPMCMAASVEAVERREELRQADHVQEPKLMPASASADSLLSSSSSGASLIDGVTTTPATPVGRAA